MKVVIDTNIMFSLFKKDSYVNNIIKKCPFELIAPEFSLVELKKHAEIIMKKSNLTKSQFEFSIDTLKDIITFIPEEAYSSEFKAAIKLANTFDPAEKQEFYEDLDFVALALKENCPLWSNDKLLKKQTKIKVIHTDEIEKMFSS